MESKEGSLANMDNINYDQEIERQYHPENFELSDCPEGHVCDSDCQNTKDCPCMEHEHTMTEEDQDIDFQLN